MAEITDENHPIARNLAAASSALSVTPIFSVFARGKGPWIPFTATAPRRLHRNMFAKVYLDTWRMEYSNHLPSLTDLVAAFLQDRDAHRFTEERAFDIHSLSFVAMLDPVILSNHERITAADDIARLAQALHIDLDAKPLPDQPDKEKAQASPPPVHW